jgi:DNA (cytosine-5)-methyltransferase 1
VGSLFSGVGLLELGLEATGEFETVWQCEIDPDARMVLRRHWPDVPIYEDVKELSGDGLAAIDVLVGGWPCQDISVAGARAGLAGERSGLFHELCRIVAETTPRWLLLENVDGLLSSWSPAEPAPSPLDLGREEWEVDEESDLEVVVSELVKLGYGVAWRVLDAQYFGVPQRRRRIILVGHLGEPWSAPLEVLAEPESVSGNPPKGGTPGEDIAAPLGSQSAGSGWNDDLDRMTFISQGADLAHTLRGGYRGTDDADRATFVPVPADAARAITAPTHRQRFDFETENFVVSVHNGDDVITADDLALPITGSKGNPGMVAYRKTHRAASSDDAEDWIEDEIANTLDASGHGPRTAQAVVTPIDLRCATRTGGGGVGTPGSGIGEEGDPSSPVMTSVPPAIAFSTKDHGGDAVEELSPTVRAMNFDKSHSNGGGQVGVAEGSMVRRLTPVECERLQGAPDGWTSQREGGKPMPDSARYRLLGNAVCTVVAQWVGFRMAEVDEVLHG